MKALSPDASGGPPTTANKPSSPELASRISCIHPPVLPCSVWLRATGIDGPAGKGIGVWPGRPGPQASIQIGVSLLALRLVIFRLLAFQFCTRMVGATASAGASKNCGGLAPEERL